MATTMPKERGDASITRVTKGGRKLTYCLTVIQQPERARACGSGAKSSADRRPVDPPPVVELRIFEGDGPDKTDVTFGYNANFFLFTTLETARPIAPGRMQPQTPLVPVLTGMPVSGMAYLDRPTEAGYFIFPDLSVRHEGKYRLSFNLYEETKEAKDTDAEPSTDLNKPAVPGATPDSSFDWRLEVKSAAFTVFSAKKFPGLAESTVLSRTVAEQGCRVRIRRDLRMRRRDGKANTDFENPAEEYARVSRTPSVHDIYRERTRSLSNESTDRQPYPELGRRISGEYPPQSFHTLTPNGRPSYLGFGGNQYQVPQPAFAQPAPPPPPSFRQPSPALYQHSEPQSRQSNHPHSQHVLNRQPHPQPTYVQRSYQQSAYPPSPIPQRQPNYGAGELRHGYPTGSPVTPYPAMSANHSAGPPSVSYPAVDTKHSRPPSQDSSSQASPSAPSTRLPPIHHIGHHQKEHLNLPSVHSILFANKDPQGTVQPTAPVTSSQVSLPSIDTIRKGKRNLDTAFPGLSSRLPPLFNGMRPSSEHSDLSVSDQDDERLAPDLVSISYKRADGTSRSTSIPGQYAFALH